MANSNRTFVRHEYLVESLLLGLAPVRYWVSRSHRWAYEPHVVLITDLLLLNALSDQEVKDRLATRNERLFLPDSVLIADILY